MDLPFIFDNAMISHMVFIVISSITFLENSKRILRKVDYNDDVTKFLL
jgi:hypothetical protein